MEEHTVVRRAAHALGIAGRAPGLTELERLLGMLPGSWATSLPFPDVGYARRVVHRDELYEIVVCAWLPGQGGSLHGHGESRAAVRVVQGRLLEVRWLPAPDGFARTQQTLAGSQVASLPRHAFHRIAGIEFSRSIHVYAPPLPEIAPELPAPLRAEAEAAPALWSRLDGDREEAHVD